MNAALQPTQQLYPFVQSTAYQQVQPMQLNHTTHQPIFWQTPQTQQMQSAPNIYLPLQPNLQPIQTEPFMQTPSYTTQHAPNLSTTHHIPVQPSQTYTNITKNRSPDRSDSQSVYSDKSESYRPNNFQVVRQNKRKRTDDNPQIPCEAEMNVTNTQNRFLPLIGLNDEQLTNRKTTTGNSTENIPPFILHFVDKVQPLLDILKSVITDKDYYYQVMKGNKIKLQVNSLANYKLVKKLLDDNKVIRHTYTLDEEKKFRVVLRNLHHTTDTKDIAAALNEEGHTAVAITNIQVWKDQKNIPKNLFFIDLQKKANNADIFKIKRLLNAVVQFEEPIKKTKLPQCTRCWCYGHTGKNCTRPYRCYKCAGNHDYKTCTKKREMDETLNAPYVVVLTLPMPKYAEFTWK